MGYRENVDNFTSHDYKDLQYNRIPFLGATFLHILTKSILDMRHFTLLIVLCSLQNLGVAQEITVHGDTTDHFSIGVPKGWFYQTYNHPSVKFIVYRLKQDTTDTPRENYNLTILSVPDPTLSSAYKSMLSVIGKGEGFQLLSEGDTTIEGKKYKWLVENHSNIASKEEMTAYVYLGYFDKKAYMLTFTTITSRFKDYEKLFRTISYTFRLDDRNK